MLVVGSVVSADHIPGSDKMLHLAIDIGEEEPRTVLSGISKHYAPDQLIGVRCVVVANLEPRSMLGLESNGMLLCASYTDDSGGGQVRVVEIPQDVPVGSRLS